jgi:hypothetical protein
MSENRKSSREAKAATLAKKGERRRKQFECTMPSHSEFVLNQIATHKRERGWN